MPPLFSKGDARRATGKPRDEAALRAWLINTLAKRLRADPAHIDPEASLADFGMDSLMAIRVTGDLEKYLGIQLEATLLWEHPSIAALVRHLAKELGWPVQLPLP